MAILSRENVTVDSLMGHGGIFKDKGIAQQYLADALKTSITCMSTASETLAPTPEGVVGFDLYAANFKEAIHA